MMFAMPILGIGIMILLYSHDGHKLLVIKTPRQHGTDAAFLVSSAL